jgi:hypothetical protein
MTAASGTTPPDEGQGTIQHPLARMYTLQTLDCVIELVCRLPDDLADRPLQYRQVPENIVALLGDFKALAGVHPDWPSAAPTP